MLSEAKAIEAICSSLPSSQINSAWLPQACIMRLTRLRNRSNAQSWRSRIALNRLSESCYHVKSAKDRASSPFVIIPGAMRSRLDTIPRGHNRAPRSGLPHLCRPDRAHRPPMPQECRGPFLCLFVGTQEEAAGGRKPTSVS